MARSDAELRDAALNRGRRLTRWIVGASVVLTGALSGLAAQAFGGRAKGAAPPAPGAGGRHHHLRRGHALGGGGGGGAAQRRRASGPVRRGGSVPGRARGLPRPPGRNREL